MSMAPQAVESGKKEAEVEVQTDCDEADVLYLPLKTEAKAGGV